MSTLRANREHLAERVQPLMPRATTIRQVFGAQCFSPYWWGPLQILMLPFMRWRMVAVADDGIHVFSATHWLRWKPKRLLRTLPRQTRLQPPGGLRSPDLRFGLWARLQLGYETVWVHRLFFTDVEEADWDLDRYLEAERGAEG